MTSSEAWRDWLLGSLSDHIAKLSSVPPRKIPALEAFQSPGSFSDKYSCQAGPGPRFPPRPAPPCLSVSCFVFQSQKPKRESIHSLKSNSSSEAKATDSKQGQGWAGRDQGQE